MVSIKAFSPPVPYAAERDERDALRLLWSAVAVAGRAGVSTAAPGNALLACRSGSRASATPSRERFQTL